MNIIHSITEWQTIRKHLSPNLKIGFVPTMGNLHLGHISLLQRAKHENDISVLSIFVNPTQFNNQQDLISYPKTLDEDCEIASNAAVDYLLLPNAEEIYADQYRYRIIENEFSKQMEGLHRPGHFEGMLTVVLKLLNLVQAAHAYFGEKDYQQFKLIDGLVKAFFLDTQVISCSTIRTPAGLAYSSRNNRFNNVELALAEKFAKIFHQRMHSCEIIQNELENLGINVEYITESAGRRFIAVYIGKIRLIDNYSL